MEDKNYFKTLNDINVNEHVETKGQFSYLSWAWAWSELKKRFPDATYTVYENASGWNYHTDGRTAWVKTGVTVNGIEHIEYLPIMDNNNRALPLDRITSFETNKTIQRSLTKAVARHGLGLYIYAGEDIPDAPDAAPEAKKTPAKKTAPKAREQHPEPTPAPVPTQQESSPARSELREFIKANGLDGKSIAQVCGLNASSTEQEYKDALVYARSLMI